MRLGAATALAKSVNITLAVRNAAQTFAATMHDYKRTAKESDSAWLRYGPEPAALDAASDSRALASNTVLLWSDAGTQTQASIAATIEAFPGFRGHLALDHAGGESSIVLMAAAIRSWRAELCR